MNHARILARENNEVLMIAPVSRATVARPRLLSLYNDQLAAVPKAERDVFLTGRAMVMRGMRLLRMPPQAIPRHHKQDWPADLTGAISHGGGQVTVWLRRGGDMSLGLDLRMIHTDMQAGPLSEAELNLLAHQPGLARMRAEERRAGAISAKHALSQGMAQPLGEAIDPSELEVCDSARSGICLRLIHANLYGLRPGSNFRVELRIMPGLALTRIAVGALPRVWSC